MDESSGIGYFIIVRYTGSYEIWSIDLNGSPPNWPIKKLSSFKTPDATNLCFSMTLGPKGLIYALGMTALVDPTYLFEITIATGAVMTRS
jgi:hypothetical protein